MPTVYKSVVRAAIATACVLLLPLVAMQFTDEVDWNLADFVVAGALLFSAGLAYELVGRKAGNIAYRTAVGVAVGTALVLVWSNLAVGTIGSEDHPANLMYLGVIAVGIVGALVARLRPQGMARAMLATALALAVVAVIALVTGLGRPLEVVLLNAFFAALFAGSAWLFRRAA